MTNRGYQYPNLRSLARPDLELLVAGTPGAGQCNALCRQLEAIDEQYSLSDDEEKRRRLAASYLAIERYRDTLGCGPCFPI